MQAKLKPSYIVYTLLTLSILFSTNNVSALSYQSDINVSFTFNPTISVSISNDLTIPSLTPGTTSDSNTINVNVSTNNAYGYNLYATVGNNTYNNTNLTNTNNIDYTFATISPTTNLSNLDTDNTWGYSYSLDNGSTWSNYNGLSLYTTDNPTRLAKTTEPSSDTINFKIAAKSGTTQASGEYSNVINFTAVTKLAPLTLAESYEAYYNKEGKTKLNGYYVMQDMNKEICENAEVIDSELQVIDNRDNKVYWIAKLRDDHCWMTQNLDLDLIADTRAENYVALTSENTDLNEYGSHNYTEQYGYSINENNIITWVPRNTTIIGTESNGSVTFGGWENDYNSPYSADVGFLYINNTIGSHGLAGNYYNWSATVASNNAESFTTPQVAPNSICPAGWKMPDKNHFDDLTISYPSPKQSPTYYVLAQYVWSSSLNPIGREGYYNSSENANGSSVYKMILFSWRDNPIVSSGYLDRVGGFSMRCLAR